MDAMESQVDDNNASNSVDKEKLRIFINYDRGSSQEIEKIINTDPKMISAINSTDMEILKLIMYNGKFDGSSLIKMFKIPNIVDTLKSMGIEKLRSLLKNGELCMELLGKRESTSKCVELVKNDDRFYSRIEESEINFNHFNDMNYEKLKLIVNSDLYDYRSITRIDNRDIESINALNITKLALCCNIKKEHTTLVSRIPTDWTSYSDWYGHMEIVIYRRLYIFLIVSIIRTPRVIPMINSMEDEKLSMMLNTIKDSSEMIKLSACLEKIDFCNVVLSMDIKKLEVLLEQYGYKNRLVCDLYRENVLNFVKLITVENLQIMTKLLQLEDFIFVSDHYVHDVRHFLDIAVALNKIGRIDHINRQFLLNKNDIEAKLKEVFPVDFPVDQILKPSSIRDGGRVSNLKYLGLEATISLIDQEFREVSS